VFAFLLFSPGTMNPTKRLTGVCSECGGSIEFPAELIGTMTQCPRCRKQTELLLAVPPDEPLVPRKAIILTIVAVVILAAGVIVPVVGLKRFERLAARQKDRAAPAAGAKDATTSAGFEVSAFSLEKGQGGEGTHAVGTVVSTSSRPRSRVTLELDLLDAGGRKVGMARDSRPLLEPGAKWQVKVPVAGNPEAVSARVASIKAGQ
jgi:hypothetical protein